ncbi:hypothetical protein C6W19_24160 [Bacillus sp. RJGP41]|nr:hypothetical protein C6W19_24160 [Bacillus sp. RJGP41]
MQIQNMRKRVPMKKLENAVEGKYYRNPFLRYDFLYSFSVFFVIPFIPYISGKAIQAAKVHYKLLIYLTLTGGM